jgi:hypothetical protein
MGAGVSSARAVVPPPHNDGSTTTITAPQLPSQACGLEAQQRGRGAELQARGEQMRAETRVKRAGRGLGQAEPDAPGPHGVLAGLEDGMGETELEDRDTGLGGSR